MECCDWWSENGDRACHKHAKVELQGRKVCWFHFRILAESLYRVMIYNPTFKMLVKQEKVMALPELFPEHGGAWLAAARTWMQWNCINGDTVKWGDDTVLTPHLTVRQVEELALAVAKAMFNDMKRRR